MVDCEIVTKAVVIHVPGKPAGKYYFQEVAQGEESGRLNRLEGLQDMSFILQIG